MVWGMVLRSPVPGPGLAELRLPGRRDCVMQGHHLLGRQPKTREGGRGGHGSPQTSEILLMPAHMKALLQGQ